MNIGELKYFNKYKMSNEGGGSIEDNVNILVQDSYRSKQLSNRGGMPQSDRQERLSSQPSGDNNRQVNITLGKHRSKVSLPQETNLMGNGFDTLLPGGSIGGTSENLTLNNQSKEIMNRTKTVEMNQEGSNEFDENYEYEDESIGNQTYYSIKALQRVYIKPHVQLEKATDFSLKDFRIVNMLGQGGFGQVFLVKSLKDRHNLMALKKIMLALGSGNPQMAEQKRMRVMRETQIMETLHHPHIVSMHAHFIDSEITEVKKEVEVGAYNSQLEVGEVTEQVERWYLCIVMEHASRGDLLHLIEKHKAEKDPIKEEVIWAVCKQIAEGLQYLHSHQVIHRDIKPQNILITGQNTFKIGDLGISRSVHSKQQQLLESKIGTPLYACPELVKKQPYDYKIDMWALGCVMHYMACLEHPFLANPVMKGAHFNRQQIEYQILTGTPKSLPEVYSNRLRIVIQRMLEKDSSRRISAQELLNLIPQTYEESEEPPTPTSSTQQPAEQTNKKNVRFDEALPAAATPNEPIASMRSSIKTQIPIQPILKRLSEKPVPPSPQSANQHKSIIKVYEQQQEDKKVAVTASFYTMPNSKRLSVLEAVQKEQMVQSQRPQEDAIISAGNQMVIVDNNSQISSSENISSFKQSELVHQIQSEAAGVKGLQKQYFHQINRRIQNNKVVHINSRKLLHLRQTMDHQSTKSQVDNTNEKIEVKGAMNTQEEFSFSDNDDINLRASTKEIQNNQEQATQQYDQQKWTPQERQSSNFQQLQSQPSNLEIITNKIFAARKIISNSQQRQIISNTIPRPPPAKLFPAQFSNQMMLQEPLSRTVGIKGLQSMPESQQQSYNREMESTFSQISNLQPLSPNRVTLSGLPETQKVLRHNYSKFNIKRQQFTDMQANQNNLAYSNFRNKHAVLSKLSQDGVSDSKNTQTTAIGNTPFNQSLKSTSIQSHYQGKYLHMGQSDSRSEMRAFSPHMQLQNSPSKELNFRPAYKFNENASQLSLMPDDSPSCIITEQNRVPPQSRRAQFNQSSTVADNSSSSVVVMIPHFNQGMITKQQKVVNTFYSPQKPIPSNSPFNTLNNTKNHIKSNILRDQSQSSIALLNTFQNNKLAQGKQLPNIIEQSPTPQLRCIPSQTQVLLLETSGMSPERHAKEFLAARLNNKLKANPSLQQIEQTRVMLSSQNRSGNQFLGNMKRNSNAAMATNQNQIMPLSGGVAPLAYFGTGSATNIIKPQFDKSSPSPDSRFGGSSSGGYMINNKFGQHLSANIQQQKGSNRFTIKDLQ